MKTAIIEIELNENIDLDWFAEIKAQLEAHLFITEATVKSLE